MNSRERIRVRPLLAVAAAFSLAACGSSQPTAQPGANTITHDTTTAATTAATTPPVGAIEGSPTPTTTAASTPVADLASPPPAPTAGAPAKPLTMPNGSPACGNVTMRAPPNPNCKP